MEYTNKKQIESLLRLQKFHDLRVQVSLHSSLNTCKGVVRCPDLKGVSEQEILEEMREQGVINVRRIKVRYDGTLKDTNTFVFTFNTSVLQKQLKVAFLRVSVDPYRSLEVLLNESGLPFFRLEDEMLLFLFDSTLLDIE